MSAQLLCGRAAGGQRRVMGQGGLTDPQSQRNPGREHGYLRAGIDKRVDPAAIELHREKQVVPFDRPAVIPV
jgi:hypothetical protein